MHFILISYTYSRKSKDQTLPLNRRESFTWIIRKTILLFGRLDFLGCNIYIYTEAKIRNLKPYMTIFLVIYVYIIIYIYAYHLTSRYMLGGGNSNIFGNFSPRIFGEDELKLTCAQHFSGWVGPTELNHQRIVWTPPKPTYIF